METLVVFKPFCWGLKCTPLPQDRQRPRSPAPHLLHTTLYEMSSRPPLFWGGLHSKFTDVSLTLEIRFWGADGGPRKKSQCVISNWKNLT